ncbi:MAG: glycosyltransferase family 4 protein [Caldilineales bacterium]|nr:glycosyltransferase family 4 protein [Caldilineales bacterium]
MDGIAYKDGAHLKILLAMEAVYYPGFGGANKIVRSVAEQLTQRGHHVQAVKHALGRSGFAELPELHLALTRDGIDHRSNDTTIEFAMLGVHIHAVHETKRFLSQFDAIIHSSRPDIILVTSEDWDGGLLETALEAGVAPVFMLVNTVIVLPFGPDAMQPSEWRTDLFRRLAGIFAISRHGCDYIRHWGGMDATLFPTPSYGVGPFPVLGKFDNPFVTLLNPSIGKGIDILLALADAIPEIQFAAVPTWATTADDLAALVLRPNVRILAPEQDIDRIWAQTRVALFPSLWPEGFGLAIVEAMLRGIPVLASDQGGVIEAKLGTDFILPVAPSAGYHASTQPGVLPKPVASPQPPEIISLWINALSLLLSNQEVYTYHAAMARQASAQFVAGLSVTPLETQFLAAPRMQQRNGSGTDAETGVAAQLATMNAHQRKLLQQWLQERGS